MDMHLKLRFDYGASVPWVTRLEDNSGISAVVGPNRVTLRTPVELHGDTVSAQMFARTDAGVHEQPRRVQGAGGDDDVVGGDCFDATIAAHLGAGRMAVGEQDTPRLRIPNDLQIGAPARCLVIPAPMPACRRV